jgi:molybdenum cofactor cytidylyltransferase
MLSSLKAGIRALATGVAGALVTVADLPTLAPATCRAVLTAWLADPERIVAPVHAGRRGHPVLFPRSLFDDILAAEHADGPRGVLRSHPGRLLEVAVDDAGCIADMDTPAEYRKICEVQR